LQAIGLEEESAEDDSDEDELQIAEDTTRDTSMAISAEVENIESTSTIDTAKKVAPKRKLPVRATLTKCEGNDEVKDKCQSTEERVA